MVASVETLRVADWPVIVIAAGAGVLAAPLLASWTGTLAREAEPAAGWWRPERVPPPRLALMMVLAAVAGAVAGLDRPHAAWWLLGVGGLVAAVVDARTHRLPARLTYPLGLAVAITLVITSALTGEYTRLARAGIAVVLLGAAWFVLAFLAAGEVGLGDVRLAAVTAAPLGWAGWTELAHAQLILLAAAVASAVVVLIVTRARAWRRVPVPLGPALLTAALLAPLW
jgi:leader peptidase (prepilin peptidase)/N-methyltransferase